VTDRAASFTSVPERTTGMVIVDLWDSREGFEEMMNDPEFQKNLKRAGTPDPDSLEVYEVHATVP
jgi:heme-degrading monooxygenase HmoA